MQNQCLNWFNPPSAKDSIETQVGHQALRFLITSGCPNTIECLPYNPFVDFLHRVQKHRFDWKIQIDFFKYLIDNFDDHLGTTQVIELLAAIANRWIIEDQTKRRFIIIGSNHLPEKFLLGSKSLSPKQPKRIQLGELDFQVKSVCVYRSMVDLDEMDMNDLAGGYL